MTNRRAQASIRCNFWKASVGEDETEIMGEGGEAFGGARADQGGYEKPVILLTVTNIFAALKISQSLHRGLRPAAIEFGFE
jgi:hypothetical protein